MYPICDPWLGQAGAPFERVFAPAFKGGMLGRNDEFCSWAEHMRGADPGGCTPPTPAQLAANANHVNGLIAHQGVAADIRKSAQAFRNRSSEIVELLRRHVPVVRLQQRIDAMVELSVTNDPAQPCLQVAGPAAAGGVPLYAPGHPNAGAALTAADLASYQRCGSSLARHVWAMLESEGIKPTSGLKTLSQEGAWVALKMEHVGFTEASVMALQQQIDTMDREGGFTRSNEEKRIRLLAVLQGCNSHADIHQRATKELLRASDECRVGGVAGGAPDYNLTALALHELWSHYVETGKITRRQPLSVAASPSNRVDGLSLSVVPPEAYSFQSTSSARAPSWTTAGVEPCADSACAFACTNCGGAADVDALLSSMADGSSLGGEPFCWCCLGFGHTKNKDGQHWCRSERRKRLPADAIAALSSRALQNNLGEGFQRRPSWVGARGGAGRGRGGGGRGSGRHAPLPGRSSQGRPPGAYSGEVEEDYSDRQFDEDSDSYAVEMRRDGTIVDPVDGTVLGCFAEGGEVTSHTLAVEQEDQTAEALALQSVSLESGAPNPVSSAPGSLPPASAVPMRIGSLGCPPPAPLEMLSTVYDNNSLELDDEPALGEEPIYSFPRTRDLMNQSVVPRLSAATTLLLGTICGVVAVGAMVARSLGPGRAKSLVVGALLGSAAGLQAGLCSLVPPVIEAKEITAFEVSRLASVGVIDTGTTLTASGRRRLFPDSKVTDWKPTMRVRAASQKLMTISLIGTMIIKPKHAAKKQVIAVAGAAHVPEMRELTLVSPKQLFQQQGIRTYFNDDCYMRLPNGERIYFRETERNYSLELDDAEESTGETYALLLDALAVAPDLTYDTVHGRLCHFSQDRLWASRNVLRGMRVANHDLPQFDFSKRHSCTTCEKVHPPRSKHSGVSRELAQIQGKAVNFGDLVASDTCSMPASMPFGFVGWVVFLDWATRWLALYFIFDHSGAEIRRCMRQFLTDNAAYLPKNSKGAAHCKKWFTDNHGEFFSNDTDAFCKELEMRHSSIVEYNPQQNPSERAHGTVIRCIKAVHAHTDAPIPLWPFTASACVMIHNNLLSRSNHVLDINTTPEMKRSMKPLDLGVLRQLYCRVDVAITSPHDRAAAGLTKIDVPRVTGVHLGFDIRRGGYYCYIPLWERWSTFAPGDLVFSETEFPAITAISGTSMRQDLHASLDPSSLGETLPGSSTAPIPASGPGMRGGGSGRAGVRGGRGRARGVARGRAGAAAVAAAAARAVAAAGGGAMPPAVPAPLAAGQAANAANGGDGNALEAPIIAFNEPWLPPVDVLSDGRLLCLNLDAIGALPPPPARLTGNEHRADYKDWLKAAGDELQAKVANGALKLVDRPRNSPVIGSGIRCSYKYDPSTGGLLNESGHRVRFFGKGFTQTHSLNFWRTYTATPKMTGVRLFAGICANFDLDTEHVDIVKAFTNNDIDVKGMHVEQMEKFVEGGYQADGKTKKVYEVVKALEGLKQSGNIHQENSTACLVKKCGLKQNLTEPTIFYRIADKAILILLLWIDDVWAGFSRGGREKIFLPWFKIYKETFNCKLLGPIALFVGLDITRDREKKTITLSQARYVKAMAKKFLSAEELSMKETLPAEILDKEGRVSTYSKLLGPDHLPIPAVKESDLTDKPMLSATASVRWAADATRFDVAFHASFLARFNPRELQRKEVWDAERRLLNYMYHSADRVVLTLGGALIRVPDIPTAKPPLSPRNIVPLHGLIMISDGSLQTNNNYVGYLVLMFNGAVDWGSHLVKVKLSSAEVEIAAGSACEKRHSYIRNTFGEMFPLPRMAASHVIDNSAMPSLTENVGASKKTEHFVRWLLYMRQQVQHGLSYVHLCRTFDMDADCLTKVAMRAAFMRFVQLGTNMRS